MIISAQINLKFQNNMNYINKIIKNIKYNKI